MHGARKTPNVRCGSVADIQRPIELVRSVPEADMADYSGSDFASWCREAGFRHFEIIPLTGPSSAAVAYK